MIDPAIIEALNQIAKSNENVFEQMNSKIEVITSINLAKERVLKLNTNGVISEIHAHASHSSHRSHNSHRSHHSHRSSLV